MEYHHFILTKDTFIGESHGGLLEHQGQDWGKKGLRELRVIPGQVQLVEADKTVPLFLLTFSYWILVDLYA